MAAIGVLPSFVVPKVPLIHLNLFPYRWEREKSVLLDTNKAVFLFDLVCILCWNPSHTHPAVYEDSIKQALRNFGNTFSDVLLITMMNGECEIFGAFGAGFAHGWKSRGSK
jgi:hypothetical protein